MARITTEDCEDYNPFELVRYATIRARYLMNSGDEPKVPWDNDKATVVALRELAAREVTPETLENPEPPVNSFHAGIL